MFYQFLKIKEIIEERFSVLKDISLQYFVYGTGEKCLITLHGFGRDFKDFMFFETLTKNYKVIGINLFFHGDSVFPENRISKMPLKKGEWKQLFQQILKREKVSSFSLLSYSMGGKFAFCILEKFEPKIEKAVFLAPDGVIENPWYKLVTKTFLGKKLSKKFVSNDFYISQVFSIATKLKLTNPNLKKFVDFNVSTSERRALIYNVWQSFKLIKPNHQVIQKKITEKKLFVVLGKKDVAIKAGYSKTLKKLYSNFVETEILDLGHNLFKQETKSIISKFLT